MASLLESRVRLLEDAAVQQQHRRNFVVIVPCKEGQEQHTQDHEISASRGAAVRARVIPLTQFINH